MRKFAKKFVRKFVKKFERKFVRKFVSKGPGFLLLIFSLNMHAAGEWRPVGGRASGMSGISVALTDNWSAISNQGSNAWNEGILCGIFYENRFMVKELSAKAFVFSATISPGTFSFTCTHFGTSIYSELKTGLGYARKFGKHFSAGVQLNYYRFHVSDNNGSSNILNCEAGLLFKPGKHVAIGFHCINPVPVKLSRVSGESLPTLFQLGLSYNFTDELLVSAEVEKDPVSKTCARVGAEYLFARILSARAGMATSPFRLSIGAGIVINRFSVDFASEYNQTLGFSPAISIQYQIRK
ncbi:MAG: hypothetical protein ACOYM0_00990 [Bacteroidales bacterium]